jgi:hypothetical protein
MRRTRPNERPRALACARTRRDELVALSPLKLRLCFCLCLGLLLIILITVIKDVDSHHLSAHCQRMAETFVKLFASMLDSTVWLESAETRLVWVTMLAMADQDGYVGASVPGLANRARVSEEAAEAALERFLAPDPRSRSKEHEGRRIAVVDRGWVLLNYAKFRAMRDVERRREQLREAQRRHRAKPREQDDMDPEPPFPPDGPL